MQAEFTVKTPVFEGPLELLLNLIEKRKLLINDVSLAQVADDYLGHVRTLEEFPMGDVANFLLVASTLVLIKSKSLLPTLELSQEEEGDIQDLERRLKEYQRIKELSLHIKDHFGKKIIFGKSQQGYTEPVFSPDRYTNVESIFSSITSVLSRLPKKTTVPKATVKKVMSLEETMDGLTERIKTHLKMSFKEFSGIGKKEKVNVIVSFLAMLELVKQGIIVVSQQNMFDDIEMETREIGVPEY